jgi:hypothetical protein
MYNKNEDIKLLRKIKKVNKTLLPVVYYLSNIKDISNFSLELVKNKINIKKYSANNALKKRFYKEIFISYPKS